MSIDELIEQAWATGRSAPEVALRSPVGRWATQLAVHSRRGRRVSLAAALDGSAKRALDVSLAGALLLLLSPLLLLVAIAVRVDSPGPAFYHCRRVGLGGQLFGMLKFRKMFDGAKGPPLRSVGDDRHTRLGRVLAGTRLDEIPQLWNVVKGQMSLVGPRPEDPSFVERDPRAFTDVLKVRPGITGLSQLAFANEADILDPVDRVGDYVRRILPQKLAMDALYVVRRTLWMDLKVLFWTVATVALRRDVAVHRATGHLRLRRRSAQQVTSPPSLVALPKPSDDRVAGVDVVILAGGRPRDGTLAGSLLPAPLMPVGDRSVLETIVEQLDGLGARRMTLCLGDGADLVRAVFSYRTTSAELNFLEDRQTIGTAGPLRLVSGLDDTFLVVNGDILTTLDYGALLQQHRASRNVLTIAAQDRRTRFEHGVLQLDGDGLVRCYREKPEVVSAVSMGVYAIEPRALSFIPRRGSFDLPQLVEGLIHAGLPVGTYRHEGLWFDVGRNGDYEDALAAWRGGAA